MLPEGAKVYDRPGTTAGTHTGSTRRCSMHGCTGIRVRVKWPDGHSTWPCSKGILPYKDGHRVA